MRVCVCALMDLWGHAGLYVFAPMWLTVCMCMCVGQDGKSEPTVVSGSIDRRLCAANVKFMYCAAPLQKRPAMVSGGRLWRCNGKTEAWNARQEKKE